MSVYVPVLHASELSGRLLEVVVVAVGEGAQAASNQGHGAEAGTGLACCVGAGGVLLAVLTITWGLQPVVCTRKGHLHDCWQRPLELLQANFAKQSYFLSLELRFSRCCFYVKLKVSGPGQFCLMLLNLIWKSQAGLIGTYIVQFLFIGESQADVT